MQQNCKISEEKLAPIKCRKLLFSGHYFPPAALFDGFAQTLERTQNFSQKTMSGHLCATIKAARCGF